MDALRDTTGPQDHLTEPSPSTNLPPSDPEKKGNKSPGGSKGWVVHFFPFVAPPSDPEERGCALLRGCTVHMLAISGSVHPQAGVTS